MEISRKLAKFEKIRKNPGTISSNTFPLEVTNPCQIWQFVSFDS